jgi:hypothetical protein
MIDNWWTRASVPAKIGIVVALAFIIAFAVAALSEPKSSASPGPDINPWIMWCPGGGVQTSWGGYCDGVTFPDGTKWHQDSFVAPFVGRVWNPIVCVIANAPAPPPLAPEGGCGRAVLR